MKIIIASILGILFSAPIFAQVNIQGTNIQIGGTSGAGSMTWPASAGVPNYSGISTWGTSYSATNPIPANFLNVNLTTTGNSGAATYTGGTFNIPIYLGFSGSLTSGHCLQISSASPAAVSDAGAPCGSGGGGGGPTLLTNGTSNTLQNTLNFVNPSSFNGLSFAFSNPTGGNETLGVSGSLNLSGLSAQAADTVVQNASGSSASPSAVSLPSCSGGSNALTYNITSHSWGCNSIASGATFPGTNGIVFNTSTTVSRNATTADVMTLLGTPPGLTVSGDSIGAGTGATNDSLGFAYLLRPQFGGGYLNYSYSGDQCLEVSNTLYGSTNPDVNPGALVPTILQECGTNDVTIYNSNANLQTTFKRIVEGNLLWAALPASSKVFAQACTSSGFSADNNYLYGMASSSTTNGSTLTCTVTTGPNGDIAVGYMVFNGGGGTFTIKVNGTAQTDPFASGTTFNAFGDGGATITTQNGTTQGFVGAVFTGFPANTAATVVFTVTSATGGSNQVEVAYTGGMPASSANNPNVVVVSPNHQNNANDALSGTYAGYESAIVTTLAGYGLNVTYADTRTALGTNYATYYSDALHPNNAGHALMDTTIEAAVPSLITNAPPNVQNGPSNIFQPNAAAPLNPSQFWSPNPYFIGSASTWTPGILLAKNRGQAYFLGFQAGLGNYIAGVTGNAGTSLCMYPSAFGELYPSSPADMTCTMGVAANGVSFMGRSSISSLDGFAAYGGNSYTNGFTNTVGGGNFLINGVNNNIVALGTATSGANHNSSYLGWQAGTWNGSSAGFPDVGWRAVPVSGTNPNYYLTLASAISNGESWGLDLSTSILPMILPTFAGTSPPATPTGSYWYDSTNKALDFDDGTKVQSVSMLQAVTSPLTLAVNTCGSTTLSIPGLTQTMDIHATAQVDPGAGTVINAFWTSAGNAKVEVCLPSAIAWTSVVMNVVATGH